MGRRTGFIIGGAALLLLVVLASALCVQSLHLEDSRRAGRTARGAREGVRSPLKERHGLRHRLSDTALHRDGTKKVHHRDGVIEEALIDGETKSGSDSVSDVGHEGREGRQDGMRRVKSDRPRHGPHRLSRHGGMRKVTRPLSETENGEHQRRSSGPRHHVGAGRLRRHGGSGKLHRLGRRGGVRKQSSLRLGKSQRFANRGMEKVLRRGASDEYHRKRAPAAKNDVLVAKEKGGSHDSLRKTMPVAQKGRLGGRSSDSGRKIGSPIVKKGRSGAPRRHRISAANNVRLVGEKRAQDSHRHHGVADNRPRHLGRQGGIRKSFRVHSLAGIRHCGQQRGTARTLQQGGIDRAFRHGGQRRGTARISQHGSADRIHHLARHSGLESRVSHRPVHHSIGRFATKEEGSHSFDRKRGPMSNVENTENAEEVVKNESSEEFSPQSGANEVRHHRASHSGLKSRVSHRPEYNARLISGRFAPKTEGSHSFGRKRAPMSKVEKTENTEEVKTESPEESSEQRGTDKVHHLARHGGLKNRVSHQPKHHVRHTFGRFAGTTEGFHSLGRKRVPMTKIDNSGETPDVVMDATVNEEVVMNVTIVEPAMKDMTVTKEMEEVNLKDESANEVAVMNDTFDESASKNETNAETVLKRAEEVLTFAV